MYANICMEGKVSKKTRIQANACVRLWIALEIGSTEIKKKLLLLGRPEERGDM